MAFRVFYRKIYITGREHIVPEGPVLFTLNHPTAFIEPCLMACYSGRTLHFLTRGDVFVNKWVQWLMAQVHLIPIYRFRDGFANLRKNDRSFNLAKRVLASCDGVLIMAEGGMRHEKRLRPIQRGAARLGFDALFAHNMDDVPVQVVGVNYTYANFWRTEVMVDIAPAFSLQEYRELYIENTSEAIEKVTARISEELRKRVVHIDDPEDEVLAEYLLQLVRHSHPWQDFPVVTFTHNRLWVEKSCIDRLNKLPADEKERIHLSVEAYFQELRAIKLHDRIVARQQQEKRTGLLVCVRRYFFALLHALGKLLYGPPVYMARKLAYRIEIVEFHSSVMLGVTLFAGMLWVLLLALAGWIVGGWITALLVLVLMLAMIPVWVWAAAGYQREMDRHFWFSLEEEQRTRLMDDRRVILGRMEELGLS
jgi:1-acyl-sn-glycerol-3-phosphate acyltransferase